MNIIDLLSSDTESDETPACIDLTGSEEDAAFTSGQKIIPGSLSNAGNESLPVANSPKVITPASFWDADNCVYRISTNITAKEFIALDKVPEYLPTAPSGFAVLLRPTSAEERQRILQYAGSYSLVFRAAKRSSIILGSHRVQCMRKTGLCSGLRCCTTSVESCSVTHSGYRNTEEVHDLMEQGKTKEKRLSLEMYKEQEKRRARHVFFFAQLKFPAICPHHGVPSKLFTSQRDIYSSLQRRIPNWEMRIGKVRGGSSSCTTTSKSPDFIGCSEFGRPGITNPRICRRVVLPADLQGTDKRIVDALVAEARQGIFPEMEQIQRNMCDPVSMQYRGRHCPNYAHGYEAVPLVHLKCKVRYHILFDHGDVMEWCIIVGQGVHGHTWPKQRARVDVVKEMVKSSVESGDVVTTQDIVRRVHETEGRCASTDSVRYHRYTAKRAMCPFGDSLSALLMQHAIDVESGTEGYVKTIIDDREADRCRAQTEQVGVCIILSNTELLKRSSCLPRFGVDGTFGTVAHYESADDFELVTIVSKSETKGVVYPVMRMLASRKTVAARKVLMDMFVTQLCCFGLVDPLKARGCYQLSMASDFETTFGIALCQSLQEKFQSNNPNRNLWNDYVECVCFGCDVHAKRIVLEKSNILENCSEYTWAVGTRSVGTQIQQEAVLKRFTEMGGKWASFGRWLSGNKVASVLWFRDFYKSRWGSIYSRPVFFDTNANESVNAKFKRDSTFLLSNKQGVPLTKIVKILESHDSETHRILEMKDSSVGSRSLWRGSQTVKRRRDGDGIVVIDGTRVSASQPSTAKRSRRHER